MSTNTESQLNSQNLTTEELDDISHSFLIFPGPGQNRKSMYFELMAQRLTHPEMKQKNQPTTQ